MGDRGASCKAVLWVEGGLEISLSLPLTPTNLLCLRVLQVLDAHRGRIRCAITSAWG